MRQKGSVYPRGNVWWIKYHDRGKPICESSKSDKESDARTLLAQRLGEIAQGKIPGVYFDRIKFDDLSDDFLRDYRINDRKSTNRAEIAVRHLKKTFGGLRATEINSSRIQIYIETRMKAGKSNGTINRELECLKRMLYIGARCTPPKVDRVPHIPMLKAANPRKGFFEHADFLALMDNLPEFLRPPSAFAYRTGWRKDEVFSLEWSQVDLKNRVVCLNPGETKNDRGRTVYLDDDMIELFEGQWKARKESGKLIPYVFPDKRGFGKIGNVRYIWAKSCTDAKIGKRLFHDFRRTAVRNMVRAGIPERVAMMVSGHVTRSIFERYNIVSDQDLREAATRQAAYLKGQGNPPATVSGTIVDFEKRRAN